jgi:RNA polymerase sigma factor (sigma-70 family)
MSIGTSQPTIVAICRSVMDRQKRRITGVEQLIVEPAPLMAAESEVEDFEALYRRTLPRVYAYAASLLRDRSAAEEVTAAAFERAFRKQRSFDPRRGTQRAWLFGIARNAALDELRRRKRSAELSVEPADDEAAPEGGAEAAERRAAVRAALADLDPRERELIALKFHAGLSNAEIADVLGVSASNAGTRVHRALARLREACHAPS